MPASTVTANPSPLADALVPTHPELVFGVVAPTGVNLGGFEDLFQSLVKQYGYDTKILRLSETAKRLQTDALGAALDFTTESSRIDTLMTAGTAIRKAMGRGDALALHALAEIESSRPSDVNTKTPAPVARQAYLVRSLKHPDEAATLRRVYGPGFFLIAVHSSESERLEYLTKVKGIPAPTAQLLMQRDHDEGDAFGQQTSKTFQRADAFVRSSNVDDLQRFLDLVFGHPLLTPTRDEHSMAFAYTAALRSAQLARQVGAVVVSSAGDVIATGTNEVPKAGGGGYWSDDQSDARDHVVHDRDPNDAAIDAILEECLIAVKSAVVLADEGALRAALRSTTLSDLTEFGRPVHAEMDALMSCARRGVSAKGGLLFTTTFPCHNCAKHIVAAGIIEVIYVEPYPKSQALKLHPDSICLDTNVERTPSSANQVVFRPFIGVAPKRHFDLFSMSLSSGVEIKRKIDGRRVDWRREDARPRIRLSPWSYIDRERIFAATISSLAESTQPDEPSK